MKKTLCCALRGFLYGVALGYLGGLGACAWLRLGYFMPYPASLPKRVGGELQAAAVFALLCGAAGALAAACVGRLSRKACNKRRISHCARAKSVL